jgi:signal transduction histidine kinase
VDASGQVAVQRAVWADPTGEATLEEAMAQAFKPAPTIVARGYQTGATWLRVTVPPTTAQNLWVTFQPTYVDDVQLYSRHWRPDGTRGVWTVRQEGDRFPFASKERRTLLYSLSLDTSPAEPTVFYVRLRTTSTQALYANVRTSTSALEFEGQTLLGLGLYLGVVLVLAWTSLVRYAVTRDTLWALNVVLQSGTVALTIFYMGLPAKYLLPQAPQGVDALMSSVLCGHLFVSVLYYWRFAAAFQAPRWVVWGYALVLLALPWQLWMVWHDQARAALSLNSNLVLLMSLLGLVANWFFKIGDARLRWMVRFTYTAQTLYLVVFILPLLGVSQMTLWHLYPALLVNLFASVMQHMVLSRRDQLDLLAKRQLEREVEAAQVQLQAKQWQLAESTSFVGMLLHELKNPLASVRLAVLNMLRTPQELSPAHIKRLTHIQSAAESMDAVLDRCRQVDRLESGVWATTQTPTDVTALLADAVAQQTEAGRLELAAPPLLLARLDALTFHTMAGNLLDNALAYSPPGSAVAVALQEHPATAGPQTRPEHLMLTVRNAVGKAGLPDANRVFDKYYRADGAHQRTGSGLGLYLVKSLAEHAGGGIAHRVDTAPDGSACAVFELWLPCR